MDMASPRSVNHPPPRFDRNANTGGGIGAETRLVPALQTVFHDAEYPSHVSLPLVPTE